VSRSQQDNDSDDGQVHHRSGAEITTDEQQNNIATLMGVLQRHPEVLDAELFRRLLLEEDVESVLHEWVRHEELFKLFAKGKYLHQCLYSIMMRYFDIAAYKDNFMVLTTEDISDSWSGHRHNARIAARRQLIDMAAFLEPSREGYICLICKIS
jgi:hypothetical protein